MHHYDTAVTRIYRTAILRDMYALGHARAQLRMVNYVYTATCSYNAIRGYRLLHYNIIVGSSDYVRQPRTGTGR